MQSSEHIFISNKVIFLTFLEGQSFHICFLKHISLNYILYECVWIVWILSSFLINSSLDRLSAHFNDWTSTVPWSGVQDAFNLSRVLACQRRWWWFGLSSQQTAVLCRCVFDSDINSPTMIHLHEEKLRGCQRCLKQSQSKAEAVISHFQQSAGSVWFQRPPLVSDIIRGRTSI